MTEKNAILLRIALRTGVFLLAIGVLIREISCARQPREAIAQAKAAPAAALHNYAVYAFDTQCRISLWGDGAEADQAATEASQLLTRLHATLNRHDEASELARFNRAPANTPFACGDLLWKAFAVAREAYRHTDGTFDVTIGPLMAFWKQAAAHPEQEPDADALADARRRVGLDKLVFDDEAHTITKTVEGMSVDFGGLAKGLALDMTLPLVKRPGISRIFLDFGGNLYLDNPAELPNAGEVLIRDPRSGNHLNGKMLVKLANANRRFIATSANSERPLLDNDGHFIGHIMDPRTGKPAQTMIQVTAIASCGAYSDIFSTAVFVDGEPLAERLVHDLPDTGFVLLPADAGSPLSIGRADLVPANPR